MDIKLKCLLKALTGYDCPFCGAQRAFEALLHGDILSFFWYNPYLVVISPYLILVLLAACRIIPKGGRLQKFLYNRYVIIFFDILTIGWWILRNIKFHDEKIC